MIRDCIDSAEPVRNHWQLAPDVISISKNVLLNYPELPQIIPNIELNYDDKLNEKQTHILETWIESIALGNVLLEQDLMSLVDRGLSSLGPFCPSATLPDGCFNHITLPKQWRALEFEESIQDLVQVPLRSGRMSTGRMSTDELNQIDEINQDSCMTRGIRKYLFSRDKVHGVDEHAGTVYSDTILDILKGTLPG